MKNSDKKVFIQKKKKYNWAYFAAYRCRRCLQLRKYEEASRPFAFLYSKRPRTFHTLAASCTGWLWRKTIPNKSANIKTQQWQVTIYSSHTRLDNLNYSHSIYTKLLDQKTAKQTFGLRVKLPPVHLSTTYGGDFTLSFLCLPWNRKTVNIISKAYGLTKRRIKPELTG